MRLLRPLSLLAGLLLALLPVAATAADGRRPLKIEDELALRSVSDPQLSPDGAWVAYTLGWSEREGDRHDSDLYMVPFVGGEPLRLTASDKAESRPRWSPDGRSLAFLADRDGKGAQVWRLDRRGGEATKLTAFAGGVSDFAWSPDGQRLALVVTDPDPEPAAKPGDDATPKPIVVRRRQMKRDGLGYLTERRDRLHVFDLRTKTSFQLTDGAFDDSAPAWSPDGGLVAFVSNRSADPDANQNSDVFVVRALPGQTPRRVVDGPGTDSQPAWSPDGKWIVYVAGARVEDLWYGATHVALAPAAGGPGRPLTAALDRNVVGPRFTADGAAVLFLVEDGGNQHLAQVMLADGTVSRLVAGERDVQAFGLGPKGTRVVLESRPRQPFEISAVEAGGALRRLTRANDDWLAGIALADVERFQATSKDGTKIDGFLVRPPFAKPGEKLPTILRIHGGPAMQFSTAFEMEWQMLAAQGYAVVAANPRGSTGYGTAFSRAIWANWGRVDFEDVMAAVDHVVAMGVADPERLGVGGWSYGGILTNYVITQTTRFKAAISGASEVNYTANYGTDHYQYEWETELGLPWKNPELYLKLSPFFHVEQVKTPTLILCGQEDWNVPLLNSEQLYQALRRLGVATELIVYPGEDHGIDRPSFVQDRWQRYLAWYDRYLRPETAATTTEDTKKPAPLATSLLGRPLFARELPEEVATALQAKLDAATQDFVRDPDVADHVIWLARRLGYLGRYAEAIAVLDRGVKRFPRDHRMYRHRGHRLLTLRQLDAARADFTKASALIAGVPDAIEPDGAPNAAGIPVSTTHFNVWYHRGVVEYVKGDFAAAVTSWQQCLKFSQGSNDRLTATSDWLYLALRRLGRDAEAAALLAPFTAETRVIENDVYLQRLLVYKGVKPVEELLAGSTDTTEAATRLYGAGAWLLLAGREEEARAAFERVVSLPDWAPFAVIAAEAELARVK
ncbi:MAG: prolyl oligopeptidase family serine peptidase [Vicinamibacteria bacterium]|nr:prolyl oligopeptidase family serine peptidase [Vicinamibacteria bacterium]